MILIDGIKNKVYGDLTSFQHLKISKLPNPKDAGIGREASIVLTGSLLLALKYVVYR